MDKRSNARKWSCLLLALLLTVCSIPGSAATLPGAEADVTDAPNSSDNVVDALYGEIENLRVQQRALDVEIALQTQQVSGVGQQKKLMDQQIALLAAEIACFDELLAYYDGRLAEEELTHAELNASYDAHFRVLSERLRQSYEEGMPGLLEFFSRSDSLLSLLVGLERRKEIEEFDRYLMESLEREQSERIVIVALLEKIRSDRHRAAAEQVERKQLLSARLQESGNYLQSLTEDLDRFSYYIQQSQAGVQRADRLIAEAIGVLEEQIAQNGSEYLLAGKAEKEALLAGKLKAAMEGGQVQRGAEYYTDGARYIWPLAIDPDRVATVSARMGYLTYQVGGKVLTDYHSGVDLAADYGKDVLAAASGKVVITGYEEGYGHFAVVYHPDGSQTRYAHLSEILVQAGDYVLQGEAIAKMGGSGNSAGIACHFELYIDGRLTDPEAHLTLPVPPVSTDAVD